jgi:Tfp pilus assembly protein PilF/TolB-like protein
VIRPWLLTPRLLAPLLAALACSPKAPAGPVRVVVLRFDNQTGDASLAWTERGAAQSLATQLAAPARYRGFLAAGRDASASRSEAIASGATLILHGTISRSGERLRLWAGIEDITHRRFVQEAVVSGPAQAGPLPLLASLARRLDPSARPYPLRSEAAFAAYIDGIEAADPERAATALERSIQLDPDFGAAYAAAVEVAAARQDRGAAERVLELARARGTALAEIDRARLDLLAARVSGDPGAQARALETLGRLESGDPAIERALAEIQVQAHRFPEAARHLRAALALQPGDPIALNQLGYVLAYAGDAKASLETLQGYAKLRPGDPNPLDSQAEVSLYFGRLTEAEDLFRKAHQADPAFLGAGTLLKAAQARLMTGDLAGADGIFNEYLEARRRLNDPSVDFRRAMWEYVSGRRREAVERLTIFAERGGASREPAGRDLASQGYAQLALWNLELGDRAQAAALARKARPLASGPAALNLASLAAFFSQPSATVEEWTARAVRALPRPEQAKFQSLLLARALLYESHFEAAVPLLEMLYAEAPVTPADETRVLLAWALAGAGRLEAAAPLVERNLILPAVDPSPSTSLAFPRISYLRAACAAKRGSREEADGNYRLFLLLSGAAPLRFGEEDAARKATGIR